MKAISEIRDKKILLDTNIVVYYSVEGFKKRSGNILRTLENNGNKISISEITAFELLRGKLKDNIESYFLDFVNYITRVSIEQSHLQKAMILADEYRRLCNNKEIPDNDLIIGGTIMAYKDVLLLTTDRNDFCEPLWETVACECFYTDENKKHVETTFYLLNLNRDLIREN